MKLRITSSFKSRVISEIEYNTKKAMNESMISKTTYKKY